MKLKEIELWDILKQYRITHFVDNNNVYRQVTISKSGDVFFRWEKKWIEIWRKRQFIIDLEKYPNTCLFIRQWVQDWWIWIANNDVHNCIVTENMPMFSVENIDINFFKFLLKSGYFKNIVNSLIPTWAAQKAIHEKLLLKQKIKIPISINEQKEIVCILEKQEKEILELEKIWNKNLSYIKQLKQAILQEAIEWKLTSSWRENNPNIESAKILLEKIQKEKEELVKQKKLKKQEKLKEISQDEIPFEIPENWSWCRLGNIVINRWWKRVPKWHLLLDTKTNHIYIRVTDMNKWTVNLNNLKYISDETFQVIKNYTISKDDVYLTIAWTIWRVWIVPDELDNMNLTENATKLTPIFVDKYFLKLFLETPFIQSIFQEAIVQMAQPKLALMRIDITLFPLPPLEEQKEIVKKVDEMMKLCDELEKQSLETKENSENLMKSVLSEVFSR